MKMSVHHIYTVQISDMGSGTDAVPGNSVISAFHVLTACVLLVLSFVLFPCVARASDLIYTIQAASFSSESDSLEYYESLMGTLNEEELDYLRVEKVGSYYSVRIGKYDDYKGVMKMLRSISTGVRGAIAMEAYIRDERIVRLFPGKSLSESSQGGDTPDKQHPEDRDYSHAVREAKGMVEKGNNKEALAVLSPYTADPLKYPVALSDYIVILVWEGRQGEAIEMYESLPESFPKRNYLLKNIAKAYYDTGNFPKATTHYEKVLKETPQDGEAQKGFVLSLMGSGEFSRAFEHVQKIPSDAPVSDSLSLTGADLLMRMGRYVEGLKEYKRVKQRNDTDKREVSRHRDDMLISIPSGKRSVFLNSLNKELNIEKELFSDYLHVLILYREYDEAIRAHEGSGRNVNSYAAELRSWIAWAYFKNGETAQAKALYSDILNKHGDSTRARLGLAYCLSKEGHGKEALNILDRLLLADTNNLEAMFGRAYTFEQMGRLWSAVEEYDRILEIDHDNPAARKLRLMALSDLGASTHAGEEGVKEFPDDEGLHETFHGDKAVDRIGWEEFPVAIGMLQPRAEDKSNGRARNDYLVARAENEDMEEAVRIYEEMEKEGETISSWLKENAAAAYLYLEQPYRALELYEEVIEESPTYESRLGRFYVLQEIREWEQAKEAINDIDSDTPAVMRTANKPEPHWPKMEVALAKGWLMLYEDRLDEGEDYFRELHEMGPADTGIRAGLSQAYLWRGWPRKALREFKIAETRDPENIAVNIGKIYTLNELAVKEDARQEAADLLKQYPRNKHVLSLSRHLELEEMREFVTDVAFSGDDEGFEELSIRARLTQPISLYTGIYGFGYWQRSSAEEGDMLTYFRRAGIGVEHVFNSDWQIRQEVSVNYNDGNDFGSFTHVQYTPDDYWRFGLSYDSFSTDISLRARVFDIEADKAEANITYRESEWRSYNLSFAYSEFSDDNRRYEWLLGYEQNLWVRNNWRERVFVELYTSSNSQEDAPYYNPDNDFGISATHMTEHTVKRIYNEAFVYRIYLTAGAYKQAGFSIRPTGSVRYEHDIDLSDTHALLYGARIGSHPYDGEAVTAYSVYLRWRLLF